MSTQHEHTAVSGDTDMKALTQAFEEFTRSTEVMEESYRRLEARLQSLDEELQEKNATLALTTEYLDSVLNSMSDGVITVDTDGTITTFNRAATRILGFDPVDVIGKSYTQTFRAHWPDSTGRRAHDMPASSGQTVPVSERSAPLADPTGRRIGTVMVFQDLREIEALREQIRRKDRLAALGEMAATVAHEIRNPLGGIRGFAALLEQDIEPSDPRARLVGKIIAGTKNLDRVVNELLEYTRPIDLRLSEVNGAELVDSAIGLLEIPETATVHNRVDRDLVIMVDAEQIRRVLLNILLNAVQSLEGNGEIHVVSSSNADGVTLAVSDTGCGIPDEDIEKVFSPFFTTREKGTGLGLAVAAKTIESHGGTITVTSRPGEGATFTLFLPGRS
ncbi:MAG: PAS domain-containing protein [Candidatus Hydrogenedentes bacterium]|nr:PAS domain-containing protein [Candidatus Hydrogenedentota bacterium]